MKTARVILKGQDGRKFPPIAAAAMWLPKALALRCERIRVEKCDGAMVAEWPIATVERFVRSQRLALQPDRLALKGRDWEYHRPVFPGWSPAHAGKGDR